MLKAIYKVRDDLSFEVEGKEQKDIFAQLSQLQDVFGTRACGLCKSANIVFVVRQNADEDEFYEIKCKDCGGKLALSQNKKGGTLYSVRKLNTETGLPAKVDDKGPFKFDTQGWHKWDKDKHAKATGKPILSSPGNKK